ncbi:MAG: signal peptidase I [Clostridia bacterium]|nr:signal peptidase I [Clostridia bacterium]
MREYTNKIQFNYAKVLSGMLNALYIIVIFIALLYLLFCNVYLVRKVEENSMQPLLNERGVNTDIVYVNKYFKDINYGDVVVLEAEKSIVKRALALPGDTIDIVWNTEQEKYMLYRNSEYIDEPYLKIDTSKPSHDGMYKAYQTFNNLKNTQSDLFEYIDGRLQYKLGDNEIFLLGDNRHVSEDSLLHGAYDITKVVGIVEYIQKENQTNFQIVCQYIFTFDWVKSLTNIFA